MKREMMQNMCSLLEIRIFIFNIKKYKIDTRHSHEPLSVLRHRETKDILTFICSFYISIRSNYNVSSLTHLN